MKTVVLVVPVNDAREYVDRRISNLADRLNELYGGSAMTSENIQEVVSKLISCKMQLQDIENAEKENAQ